MNDDSTGRSSLLTWSQKLSKLFLEPQDQEQLIELIRSASERHILDGEALSIVEGALSVAQMQARDIMIPRSQVIMIAKDTSAEAILTIIGETGHSRFPVLDQDKDEVVGILLAKDVLATVAKSREFDFLLRDLLRPVVFIPESKRLNVLLSEFRLRRNHMAIVVDEYGSIAGMVTIENVLEQIVGEIEDEHDIDSDASILKRDEQSYVIKALTELEEFNAFFDTSWDEDEFDTVGGYVVNKFGHLPERGEKIVIENDEFTVIRADMRRVHLLEMKRLVTTVEQEN
ncbi:MAG TPA: magnesium/cobalt efflux protein [Gammaproteobacteria bacterium]|nr:magnesium/cobalt efflux protein [Gammaproteobacteria bacterium]HAU07318.1 magnesium/cobalt efflux protein [Gammaproteobacteria bacterium]